VSIFGEHNGFTPIALVRNPVDRVVSHFHHLKHAPDAGKELAALVREESFTILDFIRHPRTRHLVSNYQTANYSSIPGEARSGVAPVPTNPEIALANIGNAKAFLDRCEVVGVTEDVKAFVLALAKRFAFFPDTELGRSRSYGHSEEMPAGLEEKICSLNEMDCELYEYAKRRATASQDGKAVNISRNPNSANESQSGVVHWSAGEPFWGKGWSDYVGDKLHDHVWSGSSNASIQFSVKAGERYMAILTVLRFVEQIQARCFSISCNGREISPIMVSKSIGGGPMTYAVPLGVTRSDELTMGFVVSRLLGFGAPLSADPGVERRGLALCSVDLVPCG
jgi:hypothetical protein